MKKVFFGIVASSILGVACNQAPAESNTFKTAYVDTAKLMKESEEAKNIEEKYKMKADEEGRVFDSQVQQWKSEVANFQQTAQSKGQAWAQQKGSELQRREQELAGKQQQIAQKLQEESGKEMDSLISKIKNQIKDYGKKNGLDYIYGTGDVSTVLYAKEGYDITEKLIKEINGSYQKNKPATK